MRRKRSLPRRRRIPTPRKRPYKYNYILHLFEEDFVVRCLCVTPGMTSYSLAEPDARRFDVRLLREVFKRLKNKKRIARVGMRFEKRGRSRFVHSEVFVPVYGPHYARTPSPVVEAGRSLKAAERAHGAENKTLAKMARRR